MVAPLVLALIALSSPWAVGLHSTEFQGSWPREAPPAVIRCTPTTVDLPGTGVRRAENPIARALEVAGPGTRVLLARGDYPPFSIGLGSRGISNADAGGGRPGRPVIVEGSEGARVVGGSDTIAINQKHANGYITFRNLTIIPGTRSGVIFYSLSKGAHRGFTFEDCDILGRYDHLTNQGVRTKWGVKAHSLEDFQFLGVRRPARIENIAREHAFYLQNQRGSIRIENVHAKFLGRTFCQFTARAREGRAGKGDIIIRRCVVEDACIAKGDAYKGGSAFTFAGRLGGTILVEGNVYRAGFRKPFRALTTKGQPYGTGALVAWQERDAVPNAALVLRDNEFLFERGCGDRAVVAIGGCERVLIVGSNTFHAGGDYPALSLDPLRGAGDKGPLISSPNGRVYLAPLSKITGRVTLRGVDVSDESMERLQGLR